MKEEKVEFYSQGQKIFGVLHNPDKKNPNAIIMVHGFGGFAFDEPFKSIAENLCKNDLEVLRFAFRGFDGNGYVKDMTISGEVSDLKSAIDFIEKQKINKIGLLTESLGGSIAILLNDSRVSAMLLMSPTLYFKDTFPKSLFGNYAGEKFFEEVNKINKIKESQIKAVKCPIMIVHGSNDKEVSPKQSEELFNIASEPKEFVLIEGAEHMLTRNLQFRKNVIKLSLDWFNKWLK